MGGGEGVEHAEVRREQGYVVGLYARLDELREQTAHRLAAVTRDNSPTTPQGRTERDAFATRHAERLAQLRAVEDRLCFGRLDLAAGAAGGTRRYVGRIGLSDDRHAQLLMDWRAPAAEAFYRATAAAPGDVVRRRHIATEGRTVTAVDDDVLDMDAVRPEERSGLAGEGALFAALDESRTGRMRDIVATIQAEQDRVIRSGSAGVLVVQGGPGTGKTAVALHRAAYLLYAERDRLARNGVLLVGPNTLFLHYIDRVLPALGETGVLLAGLGELLPGVTATGTEDPAVATVKGDLRMVDVVARAVAARQRVPASARTLDVGGIRVTLHPRDVAAARGRARMGRKPHNLARAGFVNDLLGLLAQRYATAQGTAAEADDRGMVLAELRAAPDVRREVNLAWMPLTPQQVLADLYASPERLAAAGPGLGAEERALLHRERGAAWTPADVPLLDEAAELLGVDDTVERLAARQEAADRRAEEEYARGVQSLFGGGMVSAESLAERYRTEGPRTTVAERAAADRTWAFGHVVVDEAQELSAMQWRLLMRRCPGRSMTVVGDIAQTGSPAGATSWGAVLDPYVPGRWRQEELTVNYRTPGRIMAVAAAVLRAAGVTGVSVPTSAREGTEPPVATRLPVPDAAWASAVADAVREELARVPGGRLAVVTPRSAYGGVRALLAAALPPGTVGGPDDPLAVLTVDRAKGLEFDGVVLLEPAAVLAESPRGAHDLYVAMTRPTRHLRVLHSRPLPPGLDTLATGGPSGDARQTVAARADEAGTIG